MSSFTVAQPAPQRGVLGIKETTYHIQVFKSQSLGDTLFMCYQRKFLCANQNFENDLKEWQV